MLRAAEIQEGLEALEHPHAHVEGLPERSPIHVVRELSRLNELRTPLALVVEWLGIVAAIVLSERFWNLPLYLCAVAFIGARQHALLVSGHEASHFTLFKNKWWSRGPRALLADIPLGRCLSLFPSGPSPLSGHGERQEPRAMAHPHL